MEVYSTRTDAAAVRTFEASSNVAELRPSATIAVSARAKELKAAGRPIIDLGAGEPDFPTPRFIRESACRALLECPPATRYTAVEGIPELREAIARCVNEALPAARSRSGVAASSVVVTTGSKQALFNSCFSLFGPGDEVLVPTPAWTSYYEILSLARATAVAVRGSRERSLKVTAEDLRRAATPRTRGLVLNSPCNPTGAVYSEPELRELLDLAAERGWWVISDEIYRSISYGAPAPSVLSVASGDRIVVVDGVAKSHAMTGWRIGWVVAPAPLARSIAALQSHTTSNAAGPSQYAALEALTNRPASEHAIVAMVQEFQRRRDLALEVLRRVGADVIVPAGAFYLFVRVSDESRDGSGTDAGSVFAKRLLEEADVAVVPGAAFRAPDWVRLSYAAPTPDVREGVSRIARALTRCQTC